MPPRPIINKKGHRTYAAAVSVLMQEREAGSLHPRDQKVIAKYLSAIVPFIEEYEKDEYSISSATPEEVLRFLMEQNNLSQYDLAKDLGGQPVVSDILNGKRKLTRDHIERLAKKFHVTPGTFYSTFS